MLTMSGRLAQSKADVTFSKPGRVETGIWEYRMVPVGHRMVKGIPYLCFAPTSPFPTPSKTYQIPFGGSARGGTSFLDCLQLHARRSRSLYAIYKIASVSPVGVLCRGHPNRSGFAIGTHTKPSSKFIFCGLVFSTGLPV